MLAASLPPVLAPTTGRLHLQPPTTTVVYEAELTWETYIDGQYQCSTTRRQVSLLGGATATGCALEIGSSAPTLTKATGDLGALEELALRLAALYERVVVQVTPTGEPVALLNHEELRQTWERLAQDLRASTTDEDEVTKSILDFMGRQLQSPESFLRSLQHDYLYQALLPGFYQQPLGGPTAPGRSRQFSNFFDKQSLWFLECVEVLPEQTPGQLTLRLHGPLDLQKTDVAAIEKLMTNDLRLAQPSNEAPSTSEGIPTLHFAYEATYVVEQATGLPLRVELMVYARAGQLYNKEYHLTLTRP